MRALDLSVADSSKAIPVPCPNCGAGLEFRQVEEDVPYFGPFAFFVTECRRCLFKKSDVIQLSAHPPTSYRLRVEDEGDLKSRVVRSSTATVFIPELGVELAPGPHAEAFISNVEGVLERVENAAGSILAMAESPRTESKAKDFIKKLEMARNCKSAFTLIIKDPLGNSTIVAADSSKISKRRLSKREQGALGFRAT